MLKMDRKGKKQSNPKPTKDGKKLKRPLNRFEIEQNVGDKSTSSKKLKTVDKDIDIDPTISYRILNFFSVFPVMAGFLCCKTCGSEIEFHETSKRGLGFKLVIKCKECDPKYIESCPLISNAYEINKRFIFAMRLLGIGLNGAEKFCGLMDLPRPIFRSFYDSLVKQIHTAAKSICNISLKSSAQEEKMKTAEALNVQETTEITVSGDGSWKKRGFSSLFGVSSLIGYYTSKVLDISVKSSFCKACTFWEKRSNTVEYEEWLQSHTDECTANHEGSSGKMEVDGIREMFLRSEDLHNVRYINYIGDGDSKTYKAIVDSVPYPVTKKECINHVQKRMGARLRKCKKENKGLGGKGKLTAKLIDDLSTFYGLAIRRHQNSVDEMYKAIWSTLYHKSSSDDNPKHDYCPEGPNSWCTWQRAKAARQSDYTHKTPLPDVVIDAITPIYKDLSDKRLLEKCLGGFTQNNNESFNNMIWSIDPKTTSSGGIVVEIAASIAVCIFNDGYTDVLKIMELLGIRIGLSASQFRDYKDDQRLSLADLRTQAATREERLRRKQSRNEAEELAIASEGTSYAPGLDALWFVTKFYRFI